jgi:hypothetical protein
MKLLQAVALGLLMTVVFEMVIMVRQHTEIVRLNAREEERHAIVMSIEPFLRECVTRLPK